MKAVVIRQHN